MATALPAASDIVFLLALSNLYHVASLRATGVCRSSGQLHGKAGKCSGKNDAECCETGVRYPQFHCSPPVTARTRATMTLNSFAEGQDGGAASECDDEFHGDDELVVALSTGWYDGGSRCGKKIRINANGKSVLAKVVDECDSVNGCDADHDFQPPCRNNIVDASPAVWKVLDVPESQIGELAITWSDA